MSDATSDLDYAHLWKKRDEVLYRVELSALYHQKRERFFEGCDKLAKATAVIGGSASLAQYGNVSVLAAMITVTSTLSLVFAFSDRSRRHASLAADFRRLEAEIMAKGARDFVEDDINVWCARERALEVTEPPALGNLVRLCQNELAVARNQPEKVRPVGTVSYFLAHVLDLPLVG